MRAEILRGDAASEFDTAERCHIIEVANDANDPNLSIARARVEPGITTAWHCLRAIEERYLIISGSGLVEVGDLDPVAVGVGDVVRIPPDTRQRISNTGSEDLLFYALCTPRFEQAAYVDLEASDQTTRP